MPDLVTVITSLTASGTLAACLIYIARSWLSERLKQSIRHEYTQKLEALKSQLIAENELAFEKLKTANAIYSDAKRISHEKNLIAIDELWKSILDIDEQTPTIICLLDIFLEEEYSTVFFENPRFNDQINALSDELVLSVLSASKHLERHRPYIGEFLWQHFFVYRAIRGRQMYLVQNDRDTGTRVHWRQDDGVKILIETVLDSEQVEKIYSESLPSSAMIFGPIKQIILHRCSEIISGQRSATDGFQIAHVIAMRVKDTNIVKQL